MTLTEYVNALREGQPRHRAVEDFDALLKEHAQRGQRVQALEKDVEELRGEIMGWMSADHVQARTVAEEALGDLRVLVEEIAERCERWVTPEELGAQFANGRVGAFRDCAMWIRTALRKALEEEYMGEPADNKGPESFTILNKDQMREMDPPMPPEKGYETEDELRARIAELEAAHERDVEALIVGAKGHAKAVAERDALRDRDEQWRKQSHAVADSLDLMAEKASPTLATMLGMNAPALRSEPIPKDVRERMEAERRKALGEE